MNFSSLLAGLDATVEDHLCDDAVYFDRQFSDGLDGQTGRPVRVMLDRPVGVDRMSGMGFTRARPMMRVARGACPDLQQGHHFLHGPDRWEVAEAPAAEDDGRWWSFEVQPR